MIRNSSEATLGESSPASRAWCALKATSLHESATLLPPAQELESLLVCGDIGSGTWGEQLVHVLEGACRPSMLVSAETARKTLRTLLRWDDAYAFTHTLEATAVLAVESASAALLLNEGVVPPLLHALHAAPADRALQTAAAAIVSSDGSAADGERLLVSHHQVLAAFALSALSTHPSGRAALIAASPGVGLCALLRVLRVMCARPGGFCYLLISIIANLAIDEKVARELHGEGGAELLLDWAHSRTVTLQPPSLLSVLGLRPARRVRANIGGIAARALINMAMAPSRGSGRHAVRLAGAVEQLQELHWATDDAAVRAVVRDALRVLGAELPSEVRQPYRHSAVKLVSEVGGQAGAASSAMQMSSTVIWGTPAR
uniref:Uncharacterized protein n=1 Tax=Calcidiscus leptoporus TaxID=127549 RepID=A0A7S0NW42_9EUKA|mmetsp:Transcript_33945/g.79477  ORF Transcript_33945/g.79477 Transcript_33945/m.79477 type:complete len:374 (+) Transcript_33945:71-1192(+)